jgi:hypothetical protein
MCSDDIQTDIQATRVHNRASLVTFTARIVSQGIVIYEDLKD